MKACCVIGHRKIVKSKLLVCEIEQVVKYLIEEEGVNTFLFGSRSQFTDLCYDLITEIKNRYNNISRIYVRAEYPIISDGYKNYLLRFYEDSYYYNDKVIMGKFNYLKRNEVMINSSEYCLFYFDVNYTISKQKISGTKKAYEFAVKNNKKIINVYK